MDIAAATAVPAGSRVTAQFSGTVPVYLTDSTFRENFANQLRTLGLDVESVTIDSQYGIGTRDYRAVVVFRTAIPGKVSGYLGYVTSAAENAGSYTPTVTIPDIGESEQPPLSPSALDQIFGTSGQLLKDVAEALGTASKGIAKTPEEVAGLSKLVIVGLVVLVALVAFGPNLRGIGSNIRI